MPSFALLKCTNFHWTETFANGKIREIFAFRKHDPLLNDFAKE